MRGKTINPLTASKFMSNKITKCECGCQEFYIMEGIAHKAEVDDEGNLTVYKGDGGIDEISCQECGKIYSEDNFNQINF